MSTLDKVLARLETLFLYKVTGENDTTEGRGGTYLVGYFVNSVDAQKAAEGKGVWGGAGDIKTENQVVAIYRDPTTGLETIRLVGEAIRVFFESPEDTRNRAIAKLQGANLSVAELQSLGL